MIVTQMRRTQTGVDRYNKPVYSTVQSDLDVIAWAPQIDAEVDGGEVRTLRHGGTLYLHTDSDVRDDDSFVIHGVEYEADGVKALWRHPNGKHPGDVMVVRRKEYVDA